MSEYTIETDDLTMRFPPRWSVFGRSAPVARGAAVDRVSLQLGRGEIFGIVGPNGAGKTTLVRLLSTMLLPSSGSARMGGFDVVTEGHRVRGIVGLVTSNERSFYWRLTGRQNLAFFADLYHVPRREGRAWTEDLLDLLDLRDIADQRFDDYSTGQKQRLAIARGLLSKPKILLMDEPTKGVDPIATAGIIRFVREQVLHLWNPTVLITSNNLTEVERLCGRVALMHRGRIVAVGGLEHLRGMIGAEDKYRLQVRQVSEANLRAIAASADVLESVRLSEHNGTTSLEISVPRGSEGFARLISGIVHQGGEVLTCTAIKASFDDVFHALISGCADADSERGRTRT